MVYWFNSHPPTPHPVRCGREALTAVSGCRHGNGAVSVSRLAESRGPYNGQTPVTPSSRGWWRRAGEEREEKEAAPGAAARAELEETCVGRTSQEEGWEEGEACSLGARTCAPARSIHPLPQRSGQDRTQKWSHHGARTQCPRAEADPLTAESCGAGVCKCFRVGERNTVKSVRIKLLKEKILLETLK